MRATAVPDLARRLLAQEAAKADDQHVLIEAAERACEKLRIHLSKRVGRDGFRALLTRALALATVQYPYLNTVHVEPDGTLVGLRDATLGEQGPGEEAPEEAIKGAVAIVEHLVVLLVTFIGKDLTLRMLSTLWPTLDSDDTVRRSGSPSGFEGKTP